MSIRPPHAFAAAALLLALAAPATAPASVIVSRETSAESLRVDASGRAEIAWTTGGRKWTAVLDADRLTFGRTVAGSAGRRVHPEVPFALMQIELPDGRKFALQRVRRLGQFGARGPWELHVARWHGAPPELTLDVEWAYGGKMPRVCGTATYHGAAFFGFEHTLQGDPTDRLGRNVYIDVWKGAGRGWYRIMGVLTRPKGWALLIRTPDWQGARYRAFVMGPNVAGDVAPLVAATGRLPDRGVRDVCPFTTGQYAGQ